MITIVKFAQLCSKFPPTALLNFACDWLALDRDILFGRLTSRLAPTCDVISLSRANQSQAKYNLLQSWVNLTIVLPERLILATQITFSNAASIYHQQNINKY